MNQSRRKFLTRSFGGAFISAVIPASFSDWALFSSPATPNATSLNDDLKELKAAITNPDKPLKWLFTGDSITQGAKHTLGFRSYTEIFSEHLRFEMNRNRDIIINTAISGHTLREILADLDWRVRQFDPSVIMLMIGTNDAASSRRISTKEFADNLRMAIERFRAMGAIPVLQTPNTIHLEPDPSDNERRLLYLYVEKIREAAAQNGVILIDHWKYWELNKEKVACEHWRNDPLHPNGRGHLQIARLIFNTLGICDEHSFTCTGSIHF